MVNSRLPLSVITSFQLLFFFFFFFTSWAYYTCVQPPLQSAHSPAVIIKHTLSTPVCTLHSQNSVHIRLSMQISQHGSILTEASNGSIYRLWVFIISGCIQGDTGVRHNLLRFLLYSMVDTLLKSFYYSIQHEFMLIKYFLLLTTSRVNFPLNYQVYDQSFTFLQLMRLLPRFCFKFMSDWNLA